MRSAGRRSGSVQARLARGGVSVGVLLWTALAISPVVIALFSSLKSDTQVIIDGAGWPKPFEWGNYARAWNGPQFGQPFWRLGLNSCMAAGIGIVLGLGAGTAAAYAVSRGNGRLFRLADRYFVLLITLPAVVTWVPLFSLVKDFGMLSNPAFLGLIYAALILPTAAVLMKAAFASFPLDLIEAAKADGCSELSAFVRIVLPLSRGSLTAVGLVEGISLWNELGLAAVLLISPTSQTLPIGLTLFQGQQVVDRPAQFADLVLMVAPIIVLYVIFQRRVTQGMRMGAFK